MLISLLLGNRPLFGCFLEVLAIGLKSNETPSGECKIGLFLAEFLFGEWILMQGVISLEAESRDLSGL